MLYIAEAYKQGRLGSVDLEEAIKWYSRAADAGSLVALNSLGRALLKSGKTNEAIKVLSNAADKDFAPALYTLGRIYFGGFGVPREETIAVSLMERAMKLGSLHAKGALAKYLVQSHTDILSTVRGVWLGFSCRIEFIYFLATQGLSSKRFQ
jgi:hypothetical protein